MPTKNSETIWNQRFISIWIINFFIGLGQFMMNTLIPKFADHLGATATVVGIVSSMFAVTALLIRPVAGPAMDYFKKNRMLSGAVALIAVAFIIYGFANSITLIIIARLIHGLGIGVAVPLSLAMASNALPGGKMASGIGIFMMGQAVTTAIGPALGLKLMEIFDYNTTFFIVAGILGLNFLLTLRLQSVTKIHHSPFRIMLNRVFVIDVLIPTVIIFCLTIAYSSINYFIVIYGNNIRGIADIGLYFTAYAISMLISRPISGKIADKFGVDKSIIPGLVLFALSFVILSFAQTLPMFILTGVVCAFGYGICVPSLQTLSLQLVPKDRRGATGNTNFIGMDSAYLVGPLIAGLIVTQVNILKDAGADNPIGYELMYRLMIIPVVIALVIFLLTRKKLLMRLNPEETEG